ncbi:MAG: hypothetical protein V1784_04130 [bacterium]
MPFRIPKERILWLAALLPLLLCGCTVIGIVAGASADRQARKKAVIPGWRIDSLKAGTPIVITTTDGLQLAGTFDGLDRVSFDTYAAAYAKATAQLSAIRLPALNDTLCLSLGYGNSKCAFRGFGSDAVSVQFAGFPSAREISLSRLTVVADASGEPYDLSQLRELIASQRVPHVSVLKLKQEGTVTQIPVDNVAQVRIDRNTHYWVTGMIVGLAADAVITAAILNGTQKESSPPPPPPPDASYGGEGIGSCPYVYSFDGERYVLDSETFSGAMFQAAQRTDVDNLDYLEAVNGTCRLRLANEQPETDHLDALSLLAVDHPRGTRVVPDFEGNVHTISAPKKPTRAQDYRGANILDLVAATDEKSWVSNPFGRDPNDSTQVRDGIEIEFGRPSGAEDVRLLVNVRNTPWAGVMLARLLELMGRDLPDWYELWNTSAQARELYNRAMIREGMLQVKVWDGREWVVRGFIWGVGPAVAKDMVVPLNLEDISATTLRVRLESTAGFWVVNSAVVDYSAETPTNIVELHATQAIDDRGGDVRTSLREIDHVYFDMPEGRRPALLVFTPPPCEPDKERSYLLKSTGYYTANISIEGEPHTDLIMRFTMVPGAFGRYAIETLNQQATIAFFDNAR